MFSRLMILSLAGLGGDWGWSFAENNDEHTHDASDSEEECKVQKAKGSGRRPVAEMEGFPKVFSPSFFSHFFFDIVLPTERAI